MSPAAPVDGPHLRIAVRAAGGLIIRAGADDTIRVVLVHRPAQDDWSFPKGKQRRGESLLSTALREVHEETNLACIAEEVVGVTEYIDSRDRPKLVRYWAMHPVAGSFRANPEVDEIAWLRPPEALLRLTNQRDRELLENAGERLQCILSLRERVRLLSLG